MPDTDRLDDDDILSERVHQRDRVAGRAAKHEPHLARIRTLQRDDIANVMRAFDEEARQRALVHVRRNSTLERGGPRSSVRLPPAQTMPERIACTAACVRAEIFSLEKMRLI